ncbi:MAG: endonuclease/exonuclease/phosphatase family protein [Phycisphaerales bacterium]
MRPAALLIALALSPFVLAQAPAVEAPRDPALRIGALQPKPRTPGAIRLATYNIENLFDDRDDLSLSGNQEDVDDTKPAEHQKAVAEAIRRVDADIIALQEIESYDALIEFREKYLKDLGYLHAHSVDVGAERGIEQAFLSRFPIIHAETWPVMPLDGVEPETIDGRPNDNAGKPMISRRSPLAVTIEVPAEVTKAKPYRLTLINIHQKSGRGFAFWREAEAQGIIDIYKRLAGDGTNANVAILGDFNATPDQKSVRLYPKAGLIDAVGSHDPGDPEFISHASNRDIDHIFVSPGLSKEIVETSAFVLATAQLRPEEDWRTAPKPKGYASDHLPVVIDVVPVER